MLKKATFKLTTLIALSVASFNSNANCQTNFNITLQTFGEGVKVELRTGAPGNSRIINSRFSSGGQVSFLIYALEIIFLQSAMMKA